ncbi:hypothetical protein BC629DRAFT_430466 [Irpex lacteus]|nr:hypothetical protein BC629DRAFT_430466 [Irpex lacteus]
MAAASVVHIPNANSKIRKQYGVIYHSPITFYDPAGDWLRLMKAYDGQNIHLYLRDHSSPVMQLADMGAKYTIVIHIQGRRKFSVQKYSALQNQPRTLASVAKQVAEVVEAYIDETQYDERFDKDTWRLGPDYIKFEDLHLIELRQITKASWQVGLGYRPSVGAISSQSGLLNV